MDTNTILLFLLLFGLFAAYILRNRRKIQDADAMAWATAAEPFVVISRHHADTTVTETAAYMRAQLTAHGNRYLNPETDVWEYVYSADALTTSRNFQTWLDLVLIDSQRRREAWREQKRQWNPDAAKAHFAGQKIVEQEKQVI